MSRLLVALAALASLPAVAWEEHTMTPVEGAEVETTDGFDPEEHTDDCWEESDEGHVFFNGPDCWDSIQTEDIQGQIQPPTFEITRVENDLGEVYSFQSNEAGTAISFFDESGEHIATLEDPDQIVSQVGFIDITGEGDQFVVITTDNVAGLASPSLGGTYTLDFSVE